MIKAKRTLVIEHLVKNLKNINGGVSSYAAPYTYLTDLSNNVFRKLSFIEEVNDFPAIYVAAGSEYRIFHTKDLTEVTLEVNIRGYTFSEDNSQKLSDDLVRDIEHVLNNLIYNDPTLSLLNIQIESITVDGGLFTPYGVAEIDLTINYILKD